MTRNSEFRIQKSEVRSQNPEVRIHNSESRSFLGDDCECKFLREFSCVERRLCRLVRNPIHCGRFADQGTKSQELHGHYDRWRGCGLPEWWRIWKMGGCFHCGSNLLRLPRPSLL